MSKKTVKRCIRPQCLAVYSEDNTSKYCDCGALLQVTEIEIPDRILYVQKKEPSPNRENNDEKKPVNEGIGVSVKKIDKEEESAVSKTTKKAVYENGFNFFSECTSRSTLSTSNTAVSSRHIGYLYLIPENEDEDEKIYKLGKRTLIGRSSDTMLVDVDLSQFGGIISRRHALITYEKDGFYITNLSENHSVHVNNKVVVSGEKIKLTSNDGVILSKKILFQFEEGE